MRNQIIKLIPVVAVALVLASCGRDVKEPGRIYMPDMTYSNSYKAYTASDIATPEGNFMSARYPAAKTIP